MHIISDKVRKLMSFEGGVEPGFSVGAGLRIVLDSSGTGYMLMREDGTIALSWPTQGELIISVTTGYLSQQEKTAITRVVRGVCPHFTPDWQRWNVTRMRRNIWRMILPVRDFA